MTRPGDEPLCSVVLHRAVGTMAVNTEEKLTRVLRHYVVVAISKPEVSSVGIIMYIFRVLMPLSIVGCVMIISVVSFV